MSSKAKSEPYQINHRAFTSKRRPLSFGDSVCEWKIDASFFFNRSLVVEEDKAHAVVRYIFIPDLASNSAVDSSVQFLRGCDSFVPMYSRLVPEVFRIVTNIPKCTLLGLISLNCNTSWV